MISASPSASALDTPLVARLRGMEMLAIGLSLAVLTNALIGPLFAPVQGTTPEAASLRVMWLPVYAVAVGVGLLHWNRMKRIWPAALMLGVLLAWPFASKLWSLDPEITGRRCTALAFTTLFGLMLGARYSWRELVPLLAALFSVLAAMSLAAGVLFPNWAVNHTTNPNDWKGIWYEKNAFGANMALGGLATLSALMLEPRRRRLWLVGFGLCLISLMLSRSKTAQVVLVAGCAILAGLAVVRRGPVWTVIAAWVGVQGAGLVAAAAWLAPETVLKALGKDPTLTGRTDIWAALLRRVSERPLLGYGYEGFWSPDRHGPAAIIRKETHWMVPTAHNGWLDLLVQLGWIGVVLFGVIYLAILVRAGWGVIGRRDGGFALVYLAVFGIFSLSESYILQHNSISWVLFVAVAAKLFERETVAAPARAIAPARQASPVGALLPAPSGA